MLSSPTFVHAQQLAMAGDEASTANANANANANADKDKDNAGTIIVTGSRIDGYKVDTAQSATKTDVPLIDTPVSVQVNSHDVIRDMGATELYDVVHNISGVTRRASYWGQNTSTRDPHPCARWDYRTALSAAAASPGGADAEIRSRRPSASSSTIAASGSTAGPHGGSDSVASSITAGANDDCARFSAARRQM